MKEKEKIMVICKANFHILTQLTKSWCDFNPCHSFISARTAIISKRMSGDHVSRARLMLTCSSFANLGEEKKREITSWTKIDLEGGAENCESNGCVCQLKANWPIFMLTHVLVCKFYSYRNGQYTHTLFNFFPCTKCCSQQKRKSRVKSKISSIM